jgi:hypothetical protein
MPPSVCAVMLKVHRNRSVMSSRKKDGLFGWLSENESLITIESARIFRQAVDDESDSK